MQKKMGYEPMTRNLLRQMLDLKWAHILILDTSSDKSVTRDAQSEVHVLRKQGDVYPEGMAI